MNTRANRSPVGAGADSSVIAWRDRPYLKVREAAEIAGLSPGSIYAAEKAGRVTFRRLAGRTLVETASFVAFLATAEPWTPSARNAAALESRARFARAAD